jgi:hypothetical protein
VLFLDQLADSIGVVLNTIAASMRTEELLAQSQAMAEELQAQQEELTETNRRLEDRPARFRPPRSCSGPSRKSCSSPTRSSRRKPAS